MRADYVDTFQADWTGGLKRLVKEGAWFRQAAYPYLTTVTCAGHATIGTGAFPHRHGIFQNAWWNRSTSTTVSCTADASVKNIGYTKTETGGDSAAAQRTPTFADEMRAQKASHVATVSLKDRSAIMLAGHGGDSVVWLDNALDGWETSSAFTSAPVPAIKAYLDANPIDADYGKTWTHMLPEGRYLHPDDGLGENAPKGWTSTFPHTLTSASGHPDAEYRALWERSPFADAYLGRLAAAIVDGLQLGTHDTTDVLAVSFSSPDLLGHGFGPRSQEIQDMRQSRSHHWRTARPSRCCRRQGKICRRAVGRPWRHADCRAARERGPRCRTPGRARVIGEGGREGRRQRCSATAECVARENGNDLYFAPGVYARLSAKLASALDAVAVAGCCRTARPFSAVFKVEQVSNDGKRPRLRCSERLH